MANKPEDVISLVEKHEGETSSLRQRFRDDYDLYRLSEYKGEEGYEIYTSNEPMTYADKIIAWIIGAELIIRINNIEGPRSDREINDAKERFFIGSLRAADERLVLRLLTPVKDQLAFHSTVRGWLAGRALIVKRKDGTSYVDVTPFDPLHTYWGMGSDNLEWICHKTSKTALQIETEYGIKLPPDTGIGERGTNVYDYYDQEINTVVMDGKVLKKPTPHGCSCVPAFLNVVPTSPSIIVDEAPDESLKYYGESVYKGDRDIYETWNFVMSVMKEMVARSKKQGIKVKSSDGSKTLDEDPFRQGSEVSLEMGREDVEPMGLMEMAKETGAYLGLIGSELQRGALPHSVFGELQFQLSGFAINSLRQGILTQLEPRMRAVEVAYKQIINLLNDQYATGAHQAIELSGRDNNRQYFSESISPDVIRNGGDPEITLAAKLPQDEASVYALAQMAREGPTPLLPDIFIRDEIMGLQNADRIDDSIKEQLGERMLPKAALWTLMAAMENRGRPQLAQFYYEELLKQMFTCLLYTSDAADE